MILNTITKVFKSTFLKEAALYGMTGVLSRFSPLLTIPIYINFIGIEGFGYLDLYITIGVALFIVFEMQVVSGVMRSYYERQKQNRLGELIGSSLKIYAISYILLLALYFIVCYINPSTTLLSTEYLTPIVLAILPQQIYSLASIVLRMEHKAKEYVVFSLSNVALTAASGISFIYLFEPDVLSILYGILFAQVTIGIVSAFKIKRLIKVKLSTNYIYEIITYGFPIAISTLGGWLLASSGRLVLAEQTSAFELGSYSLALKVSMIYMVLLQAFRTAWDPYCMKKFAELDSKEIFAKFLNYYWLIGAVGVVVIYFLSPFIFKLFGANSDIINRNLIILLLIGYYWQGAINIIAVGTAWARKTYLNLFGTLVGGACSLLITYALVNTMGIVAGGFGYALGVNLSFFIILLLAQYQVKIPYNKLFVFVAFISSFLIMYLIS